MDGYNIYDALSACKEYLTTFGGHPQAAGLTIPAENVVPFRRALNAACPLSEDDLQPTYRVDCLFSAANVDLELAKTLQVFMPTGKGNEQPLFADQKLYLEHLSLLGKNEQVVRWYLRNQSGFQFEAIDFSGKERLYRMIVDGYGEGMWRDLLQTRIAHQIAVDILYRIEINEFNNRESVRVQIIDFRPANLHQS